MPSVPTCIALIPARSGSKRLPHKNVRRLNGHPLLAYTIAAARQSEVFASVMVSTDSPAYASVARYYGAEVPFLRPAAYAGDVSPDIEWVESVLTQLRDAGQQYECFSILRPTSPFRQPATIRRAWQAFQTEMTADSIRAVEKCRQHPGKMWLLRNRRLLPLLPLTAAEAPWHSSQIQTLPEVYAQNASLEIAWSRVVFEGRTIAGEAVMPFFTKEYEGLDLNQPLDWLVAELLLDRGLAQLPAIDQAPFPIEEIPL
jgi:CMP-N,N'-diacetyllegionaminic acid synthase